MRPTTGKKTITAPGLTGGATREKTVETHSYAVLLTEIGGQRGPGGPDRWHHQQVRPGARADPPRELQGEQLEDQRYLEIM